MIRERADCTFFMITKRPERIKETLPPDWGTGWDHVTIAVTCENQKMADHRLPIYLSLPLRHYAVMIEPMLSKVNLRSYFTAFRSEDGKCLIQNVSCGGESGPNARICDYAWILDVHMQCIHVSAFRFLKTAFNTSPHFLSRTRGRTKCLHQYLGWHHSTQLQESVL